MTLRSEINPGDKIYTRNYWDSGEKYWNTYEVKYVKNGKVHLKGKVWTIKVSDINEAGEDFFTDKKELCRVLIARHKLILKRLIADEIKPLEREIEYLKKIELAP